ncbi:glycosyltransferase family protein [Picosynechococcus sp. NKBG15041c]|uniref:glycosyltransferase family protein n=1 Tax=Picosynechococcus sp. NKBG15041c TaxID=1407650 RepID=UPI000408D726|nr:glycosyltransferase [Picosynechococcus sp. NKBG15041c]
MQSAQEQRKTQRRSPKKSSIKSPRASRPSPQGQKSRYRIALYSHDTMGLGHKRRNLLIAQTLQDSALPVEILVITGTGQGNETLAAAGIDYLNLPALKKQADGSYKSRHLYLPLGKIIAWRSQLILTAIEQFQPDVFIVDNVPRGVERELDLSLAYIQKHPRIRCVLGLRDVLDQPEAVRRDWQRADNETAIRRYYDAVWIYGDPQVYDLRREYHFAPDIIAKMQPLGYFDQRDRLRKKAQPWRKNLHQLALPERFVLGAVGGGQDGAALAIAFAQMPFSAQLPGVLLTGPFMPAPVCKKLQAIAQHNPNLIILPYHPEPTVLMAAAERVITMGGYNTTCEILSFRKQALIIPRITPRQEQWLRANRLKQLGLVDVLHPNQVNTKNLTTWLQGTPSVPPTDFTLNLQATQRLPLALSHVLAAPSFTAQAS